MIYRFRGCVVNARHRARTIETLYPDNSIIISGASDPATTRALGYGLDAFRCACENQLFHTVACEMWGLIYSPALWKAAHDQTSKPYDPQAVIPTDEQCQIERALILDLQAFFRKAKPATDDIRYLADAGGVELSAMRGEFHDRIREARRLAKESRCQ